MSATWKKCLSNVDDNISMTLKKINAGRIGISFVLDNKNKLIGTVTDGDIRRAMIKGLGFETKIKKIMNKNWKGASEKDDIKKILQIMNKYDLLQLPILDKSKKIKDVYLLSNLTKKLKYKNTIFIMAGGFGKRLMPLTKSVPKPMLKISGKPILELILNSFTKSGFNDFVISTHYKASTIENYFKNGSKFNANIRYIREKSPLGTAGSLGKLKNKKVNFPMVVINGDVLTKVNFEELLISHQKSKSLLTVGVCKHTYQVPYGVLKLSRTNIKKIDEKPMFSNFINAGIYVIEKSALESINKNKFMNMTDIMQNLISANKKINSFLVYENWTDIGLPNDFTEVKNNFK